MSVSRETALPALGWAYEQAERDAIRGEAAPSLDTKGPTLQREERRRHNSTERAKFLTQSIPTDRNDRWYAPDRRFWMQALESSTALVRERRAEALEDRGREKARELAQEWKKGGGVARDDRGQLVPSPVEVTRWHAVRAEGKRRLFERVAHCPDAERKVEIVCRARCGHSMAIKIGCNSQMFCPDCRADAARRMRIAFNRKRLGLLDLVRRSGNLAQKKLKWRHGRWVTTYEVKNKNARVKNLRERGVVGERGLGGLAERFLTLTVPHVGNVGERIEIVRETWSRFWRVYSDRIRKKLRKIPAGITLADTDRGFRALWNRKTQQHESADELSLWDLISYLWVLEWTEGDDRQGHPHIHCWLVSTWIEWQELRALWSSAYAHVMRCRQYKKILIAQQHKNKPEIERLRAEEFCGVPLLELGETFTPLINTDIRAIKQDEDPSQEIVKYLTKDWSDDKTRRVDPEVFAEVYATLDGKRRRQTSAGLSHWELERYRACPCCGYERERGHWAFVSILVPATEAGKRARPAGPPLPPMPTSSCVEKLPLTQEQHLRREYEAKRDAEWLESVEYRVLKLRAASVRASWKVGE